MEFSYNSILSSRPDPLDVLKSTAPVIQSARYVSFNPRAIERAADALAQKRIEPPAWNFEYHFFDGTARSVNYLFLLDTLNFCFWGNPRWTIEYKGKKLDGYWALAASLKRAAEENPRVLEAEFLANISPQELASILRGRGETESPLGIPLFAERWRGVRELGTVLRDRWGGNAARFVESAQGDAARLAQMIADSFSSFNDVAIVSLRGAAKRRRGNLQETREIASLPSVARNDTLAEVYLFKRAQILVTDLWGSFQGKSWGEFKNIDALTAFADYKLPQILRAWGILKYTPSLAKRVDAQIALEAGSAEEVEIRAATLWAVEFLREALAAHGQALMSIQVDWILWEASQGRFPGMKPYHRVRTVFY
jgi:hypothetical protein